MAQSDASTESRTALIVLEAGSVRRSALRSTLLLLLVRGAISASVAGRAKARGGSAGTSPEEIRGRILEGCSCAVPCACNFGQRPSPHPFCDSLAFFEVEGGALKGVSLRGVRFAIASRGGVVATVYLDSRSNQAQGSTAERIARWVLSSERTKVGSVVRAPIKIHFGDFQLGSTAGGEDVSLTAEYLLGNDGKTPMTVSHPWIFGAFPVTLSRKCVTKTLRVRAPGLHFDYAETNGNDGVFDFASSRVP